jgi:hypothetical protein
MAIMDLFYTETIDLYTEETSKPDNYGICYTEQTLLKEKVVCAVNPISTQLIQEKYGIKSKSGFECSCEYFEGCEEVRKIQYEGKMYKVATYTVNNAFLILPKEIVFVVSGD